MVASTLRTPSHPKYDLFTSSNILTTPNHLTFIITTIINEDGESIELDTYMVPETDLEEGSVNQVSFVFLGLLLTVYVMSRYVLPVYRVFFADVFSLLAWLHYIDY